MLPFYFRQMTEGKGLDIAIRRQIRSKGVSIVLLSKNVAEEID